MTIGPNYEHERLLKYARALGVAEDPVALAQWKAIIEQVIMVADEEVVLTLSEHASAHNHHLELARRKVKRMEDNARKAVLDHNCTFFQTDDVIEHHSTENPTSRR